MTLVSHGECVKRFTNKDCSVVPPQLLLCIYLPQLFAVKGVIPFLSLRSVFLHHRCPTLNPTSERKQYWSCTRCFWSTQSPSALLSPGSRRNWRTQTQVLGKTTACSFVTAHLWQLICDAARARLRIFNNSQDCCCIDKSISKGIYLALWHVTRTVLCCHTYLLPVLYCFIIAHYRFFSRNSFALTQ